ncbi:MAG TPA: hypothetical protein VGL81_27960 [Polyangiaceae bacterium]|jgi:hypothetical protein
MLLEQPSPLVAFALRRSLVPFSALLAELSSAQVFQAANLARALPPFLDEGDLVPLLEVLRRIPTPGNVRGPLLPVERELVRRGRFADALGDGRGLSFQLFEEAWPRLGPADRPAWTTAVIAQLEALVDDAKTTTLKLLDGAKVALHLLPAPRRDGTLVRLASAYEAEDARGDYEGLDYPYGTIDPGLEMACTFARAAQVAQALAYVEHRGGRFAQVFNAEELEECARIVDAVPPGHMADLESRFTVWAKASVDQEDPAVYLARWLTRPGRVLDRTARAELTRILEEARAGEALGELVGNAHAPEDLRAAARARLVELVVEHVATLATSPPASSPERDWARHAFASRQLRAAIVGLRSRGVALDEPCRAVVDAAARRWSAWFANESTSDWLEHGYTAIGFAQLVPGAVPEAARRFDDLARAGEPLIAGYDGFEALLGEDRAVEMVRALLAGTA